MGSVAWKAFPALLSQEKTAKTKDHPAINPRIAKSSRRAQERAGGFKKPRAGRIPLAPKKELYGAVQVGDEGIAHRTEEEGIEGRWTNQLGGVAQALNHNEDSQEPKKADVHETKERGLPLRGAPPAFLKLFELGF